MSLYSIPHSYSGARAVVDRTGQVLGAEIQDSPTWPERPIASSPRREESRVGEHGIVVLQPGYTWSAPIHSSIVGAGVTSSFTPLLTLAIKGKRFDDRLYAAIERVAHGGAGERDGLFAVLERIRERLASGTSARGLFDAAHYLAGGPLPETGQSNMRARKWLASFLGDPKRSKPIGFYAESEELERLFKHDRLLQSVVGASDAGAIRDVLDSEPSLREAYRQYLELLARLTGPLALPSVEARDVLEQAFLPPSDSAENRLIRALFGTASIPPDVTLGSELVTRIRDGRMPTEPQEAEGWYAHQFHAIAALLAPETQGLRVGDRYRKELTETFQALFVMNRETHVKQLELLTAGGGPPFVVAPAISVEPVPEFYARTASGYRYLRGRLSELLGEHVLKSTELVPGEIDVFSGLVEIEALFRGAEVVSRTELGQHEENTFEREIAQSQFRIWQRRSDRDPDLTHDLRTAVPVWFDTERRTVHISAIVGVATRTLRFEFLEKPKVTLFDSSSAPYEGPPEFSHIDHRILSPITIECDVREPPSRREFRAICDEHREPEKIRAALATL